MAGYDYTNELVYNSRPYHDIYISDNEGEDDDICVWKDLPDLSDYYNSDDESLAKHSRTPEVESVPKPSNHSDKKEKSVEKTKMPEQNNQPVEEIGTERAKSPERTSHSVKKEKSPEKADRPEWSNQSVKEENSIKKAERLEWSNPLIKMERSDEQAESPKMNPTATQPKTREDTSNSHTSDTDFPVSDIDPATGRLTPAAYRERELQYALSTARRNLTHVSQFLLKLEARAGKTTKLGIRQTLDATVWDRNYDFGAPPDADHKSEIDEINHLSGELYTRIHRLDRHWRRVDRAARHADGTSPAVELLGERDTRDWIRVEVQTNHLAAEETCFYTARDLKNGRSFRDWGNYLRDLCEFGDHPSDQAQLVALAWRFLDRALRPPRPGNPTTYEQLIRGLEAKRLAGGFDGPMDVKRQENEDLEAWKAMRRYWTSRTAPA